MGAAANSGLGTAPLSGVRVLDLTQALAGPYCTMILADLGADVIKVEAPGRGDDTREWGPPFVRGESAYFMSINRNKRSVALNLKSAEGLRAALELASQSDALVENFRPGTITRLGLGPDRVRQQRPELIYCSISGFGQDGSPRAGYDQVIQGTAGLMSITGMADGPPVKLGVPISDIVAGMFAAHALLAALFERERTGKGRTLDIAMQDSVIALLTFQAGRYFATGKSPLRAGNHHPSVCPYGTFETTDGYINICVGNDIQWNRFCDAIEAPELRDDGRFTSNAARVAERDALHQLIQPRLSQRSTGEWIKRLADVGVPSGAIRGLDEVFADDEVLRRGMMVDVEHPVAGPLSLTGAPWKLDGGSSEIRLAPPVLGQHTEEVLVELLGYGADDVERMATQGEVQLGDKKVSSPE
jgi:crotonobetainyl-CoA:carnitine CoA-transferase CaiB-like acyl-CoA transferase